MNMIECCSYIAGIAVAVAAATYFSISIAIMVHAWSVSGALV